MRRVLQPWTPGRQLPGRIGIGLPRELFYARWPGKTGMLNFVTGLSFGGIQPAVAAQVPVMKVNQGGDTAHHGQ